MKPTKKKYRNKSNLQKPYCNNVYAQYAALKKKIDVKYSTCDYEQRAMYEDELKELAKRLGI